MQKEIRLSGTNLGSTAGSQEPEKSWLFVVILG
jgi:hypothetical protein